MTLSQGTRHQCTWAIYTSESAFDTLSRVVGDQAEAYRTRGNASTALASCAKKISPLMESRANATLIDALQDPHPHVRLCAVSGLKILSKEVQSVI